MSRKRKMFTFVTGSLLAVGLLLQLLRIVQIFPSISITAYMEKPLQLLTASASELEPPPGAAELELKLYVRSGDTEGVKVFGNLVRALELAKLPWEEVEAEDIEELEPRGWQVLVLCGEQVSELELEAVKRYVSAGGRLAVLTRFLEPSWNELLGIRINEGYLNNTAYGIQFIKSVFPGYPSLPETNKTLSNSMLKVELNEAADVYAAVEKVPLLWTHSYGQGKVLVWNATGNTQKSVRGLLVHSLGLVTDSLVTAQVGIRSLNIDDFPSPAPDATNPIIAKEYGMSTADYYERVWWTDMERFALQYNWKYTGLMIGNYRNETTPPFASLVEEDAHVTRYFGSKLLRIGGELGVHGYNHQSLVTTEEPIPAYLGYKPWPNVEAMTLGLKQLAELAHYHLPEHELRTYVPPSNILGPTGKEAIAQGLPSVSILAGLYEDTGEPGVLVQEFGPDPDDDRFYSFPRMTSGYWLNDTSLFLQNDVIANLGLVHHFVHPDDVLDSRRSFGKGWGFLSSWFEDWMNALVKSYPHLEPLTVRDAVNKLSTYQDGTIRTYYTANEMTVVADQVPAPIHYIVRAPSGLKPVAAAKDFSLFEVDAENRLWRVEASKSRITITFQAEEE
ncbi:DUF2194 domain-containing protein [Paenibacillus sp. YYML68]|uniref:DUF2194 domain-containing protein n=1 Tax=Paenibacillus sp. YYML68 TaxID=2909250 RepID=UPI0024926040|nr:DUF2194 domain-containing protein [Paenibacillus sp. YYML68]